MASPGLQLLLLVSASLLLQTMSQGSDNNELFKHVEDVEKAIALFQATVVPFLGLIPNHGSPITTVINFALGFVTNNWDKNKPILDKIDSIFDSLASKLDKQHAEQKWDTWAGSAYHKPELEILLAWSDFKHLRNSFNPDDKEKEKQQLEITEFTRNYPVHALKTLHLFLTAKDTAIINNLGMVLAEKVRCHEKDIKVYVLLLNVLIYKANTMNLFYYKQQGIESGEKAEEAATMAYESASALYQTHKYCLQNSLDYVYKDVMDLINKPRSRGDLAEKVRVFLSNEYDRYNWMVVANKPQYSDRKVFKFLKSHYLTGFTEVNKGELTVAVARQFKGSYTKAKSIIQDLDKCFNDPTTRCSKVADKVNKCVNGKYSAVHAYRFRAHDSVEGEGKSQEEAEEDEDVEPDSKDPDQTTETYIFTGRCELGGFRVMIKSDEELEGKDPCVKLKCNDKSTCVKFETTAWCECKKPFYGPKCESSLDQYKTDLKSEIKVVDSRQRTKPN